MVFRGSQRWYPKEINLEALTAKKARATRFPNPRNVPLLSRPTPAEAGKAHPRGHRTDHLRVALPPPPPMFTFPCRSTGLQPEIKKGAVKVPCVRPRPKCPLDVGVCNSRAFFGESTFES